MSNEEALQFMGKVLNITHHFQLSNIDAKEAAALIIKTAEDYTSTHPLTLTTTL